MQSSLPYRLGTTPFLTSDVYGDGTLIAVEFLQFIDFREPSRSHAAGKVHNGRPGCNSDHILLHESFNA